MFFSSMLHINWSKLRFFPNTDFLSLLQMEDFNENCEIHKKTLGKHFNFPTI